ncbi:LPS export ABC transporter periplasmic protein LptC [Limnofasciculus baicalensis]|uniref:LPS export ABC transporter periplasmic protein LptC n=1 Tax=Limnofasciculus baicalensis BBK-W-15 TaxID=2699891 RepID=A0AAE3GV25_9CYAN|nr:LPS export ABC transporter periplasmic protein LptC [Limnofasciculus baicalensis]MCP2729112.1 LPS export ABC transporter periplasmic protein LptC [Limnofasciculus baicalensis BBK-W-15]
MVFSFKRFIVYFLTLALLSACQSSTRTEKKIQKDTAATEIEGSLVFNNVTLNQADEKGSPLWQVKAKKATYIKDKKIANIEQPTGDLFQDGKLVLRVSADSGEVHEDGEKVLLKGHIIATDTRNGAVLNGDELEWFPKQDLLWVRNNLKGSHPQLQATGNEGRYFTRQEQLELQGKVAAIAKDPDLQMKTEHLIWQIKDKKLIGDKRMQMERYKDKIVTDRVESDLSEYNLTTKIAILKQNIQLTSIDPPLLIASNSAIWDVKGQTVLSDQPVKIIHQKEQVVITGNQGRVDLVRRVANLTGGVQGVGSRNQSQLYATQMRWDIPTQNIDASGNVIYKQLNPPLNVTGATAKGKLQDQSIVVNSGAGSRVVTEIIP